jgi:hypothetical protein
MYTFTGSTDPGTDLPDKSTVSFLDYCKARRSFGASPSGSYKSPYAPSITNAPSREYLPSSLVGDTTPYTSSTFHAAVASTRSYARIPGTTICPPLNSRYSAAMTHEGWPPSSSTHAKHGWPFDFDASGNLQPLSGHSLATQALARMAGGSGGMSDWQMELKEEEDRLQEKRPAALIHEVGSGTESPVCDTRRRPESSEIADMTQAETVTSTPAVTHGGASSSFAVSSNPKRKRSYTLSEGQLRKRVSLHNMRPSIAESWHISAPTSYVQTLPDQSPYNKAPNDGIHSIIVQPPPSSFATSNAQPLHSNPDEVGAAVAWNFAWRIPSGVYLKASPDGKINIILQVAHQNQVDLVQEADIWLSHYQATEKCHNVAARD